MGTLRGCSRGFFFVLGLRDVFFAFLALESVPLAVFLLVVLVALVFVVFLVFALAVVFLEEVVFEAALEEERLRVLVVAIDSTLVGVK